MVICLFTCQVGGESFGHSRGASAIRRMQFSAAIINTVTKLCSQFQVMSQQLVLLLNIMNGFPPSSTASASAYSFSCDQGTGKEL